MHLPLHSNMLFDMSMIVFDTMFFTYNDSKHALEPKINKKTSFLGTKVLPLILINGTHECYNQRDNHRCHVLRTLKYEYASHFHTVILNYDFQVIHVDVEICIKSLLFSVIIIFKRTLLRGQPVAPKESGATRYITQIPSKRQKKNIKKIEALASPSRLPHPPPHLRRSRRSEIIKLTKNRGVYLASCCRGGSSAP